MAVRPHTLARPFATEDELPEFLTKQILTYIGSKRALLGFLDVAVAKAQERLGKTRLRCFDVFSGTGIVARSLKRHATSLVCGDLELYSEITNHCYLSNRSELDLPAIQESVAWVNEEARRELGAGFIAELYAPDDDEAIREGERVFYTRRNACFLDTARQRIDELDEQLRPYVLAPLLYMASAHTNTSGVFKGFYKNRDTGIGQFGGKGRDALTRILREIAIPVPVLSRFECEVELLSGDANDYVQGVEEVDLAYVDPPYNQHPYGSNYFMLNLLATYERPERTSVVSGIPVDWKRSRYNKRRHAREAFSELVQRLNARMLLVSFNSEGFISHDEMREILGGLGRVEVLETQYNTFRGSRNLRNRDLHVREYLYLVEKTR
jgi:adenine-specific DNA-methyltransferase